MTDNAIAQIPKIENYHPLDVAGDSIWMPVPKSCSSVLDTSYDVQAALIAWNILPVCNKSAQQIMHPDDATVGKFTLPDAWTVKYRGRLEWSLLDQNKYERIRIYYEPGKYDYIVLSHLCIPFYVQTRISQGEVPPKDWWMEMYHHEKTVFKSDIIQPNTKEVLRARDEMSESQFATQVFLPKLHKLEVPLEEALKTFLVKSFPYFPADPTAYW